MYNLEQIQKDSPWLKPAYIDILKRYPVWDYSQLNINKLKDYGVYNVALCEIGYMPALTRIEHQVEDVDVLFVGSLNDRRKAVLGEIARHGKNVCAAINSYGKERDQLIARAKIIINIHYYEAQLFEIVRVSYLLANHKCVVSETGFDNMLEAPLRPGIAFADYEDLPATCLRLLENPQERQRLGQKGFDCFSKLSQVEMLKHALSIL